MPIQKSKVTIFDVARASGVSSSAVSYALNGKSGVSDVTRDKVLKVAHELGWKPNGAAQALAKKEGCLKCHALDKKKEADSLKAIAKKLSGKPDAEAIVLKQITTGVKVKMEDGTEEEHKIIKTKYDAEIKNMIQWILSLK